MNVSASIQYETRKVQDFISKMALRDEVINEFHRQEKPLKVQQEQESSPKDKPLRRMNHRQVKEVAVLENTFQWLDKVGLKDSTEAPIMASQEQVMGTGSIKEERTPGVHFAKMPLRQSRHNSSVQDSRQGLCDIR